MTVKQNLEVIQQKINEACERSGRDPEEITLIGVTKYVSNERTKEAIEAGIVNVGENRTDEFLNKYNYIDEDHVKWHFIGTLQSRKTREIIHQVDAIHSLDRTSLARQINNRAEAPVDCFVQVNVSGETSKHGLDPENVINFVKEMEQYEKVHIIGLMTMAPHIDDETELRKVFKQLKELSEEVQSLNLDYAPCDKLSMGMSNDYEIAIEEGATHIRIGTKLVGS